MIPSRGVTTPQWEPESQSFVLTFTALSRQGVAIWGSKIPELSDAEARVLGCLMEKAATTPEHYPLSLNALVNACNQSTNRDPVVHYDDDTVEAALTTLPEDLDLAIARTQLPARGSWWWAIFAILAVSGFLVIWGLLKYLKRHDFKVFMLYRLAVAGHITQRPAGRRRWAGTSPSAGVAARCVTIIIRAATGTVRSAAATSVRPPSTSGSA